MTTLLRDSLGPLMPLAVMAACLVAGPVRADDAQPRPPRILLVDEHDWEGAAPADVVAVLESAGRELLRHVPAAGRPTIAVAARGGPIALFDRTPEGHFQVRLDTGGNHWAQYAFQFGHEVCHVLCRSGPRTRTHLWFEEALCETASLFVLRRMADAWEEEPPYPNWRDFAPHLADYAAKRLAQSPRPESLPLADWYPRHRAELRERPTDRDNGLAIAAALLPVFEESPGRWAAIHWLNAADQPQPDDFRAHLAAWRDRVPPEQAATVEAIAEAFGTPLPPAAGDAGPRGP
jgi:hypothetical protein